MTFPKFRAWIAEKKATYLMDIHALSIMILGESSANEFGLLRSQVTMDEAEDIAAVSA